MRNFVSIALSALFVLSASAQTAPAAGSQPADDKPTIKFGGTIFADYTWVDSPTAVDADGNTIHPNAFNVTRAYLNVTGQLYHRLSYRITPDITREGGSGSSLNGSQTFRLKYAFAQFNLDDWTTKGSFVRLGLQQTPYIDSEESAYRYRFQGPIFVDREGYLTSSDNGLSAKWVLPGGYGDLHGGFYNGEGYSKPEANDEKSFQIRATVRPFPHAGALKGLRFTAFYDADNYVSSAARNRLVGNVIYEHPRGNAGLTWIEATDRTSASGRAVDASGYSVWVTPKLPNNFEVLARHDRLEPDDESDRVRERNIVGLAYWVPTPKGVSASVMLDYDSLEQKNYSPARTDETRYGVHVLVNF